MTDLPPLAHGRVVGRFVAGVADSTDAGDAPDVVPLAGTVTFTLSAAALRVVSASPVPTTIYPQPITANLDADGYLTHNGTRGVSLLATDDPATNPTDLQYTVTMNLWMPETSNSITAPSWRFALPGGSEVDLTQVAPIETPAPNTIILKGERGDPGPNIIPTNQAVADAVSADGPAKEVLLSAIGAAVGQVGANERSLDAVAAALDMREPRALVIASAGDSTTSPFSTGAFMRAWKELAVAVWPDRPFRVFPWGKESNAYPSSPTVWQDAAVPSDPGGDTPNSIIAADSFALNGGDMTNRPAEVGSAAWSSTAGAFTAVDGVCIANPSYSGGGIPGVTLPALARVGGDFDYRGEWRISSQDSGSLQRRLRAAVNGASGEIRMQATGATTITVTVTKIIGGTTTTLGTFPAGTIPSNTASAWYAFQVKLVGTTLTLTLNGQTITYTLDSGDPAALGATFGMADNSRNAGIRAFEVRGTVTRPPVVGGPSPLGWATVYNAAVAGSTIAYQQARIPAMYPVQPDVLFIHHGHNYASGTTTPEQFFAAVDTFLTALFAVWSPCPVVISSQNPEFAASEVNAARIGRHLAIQRSIRGEAQRRGWGYVPVFEAFAARSDGGASYVQPDGIHPVIGNGTNLQTDTLKAWIRRRSLRP